jgi:hypothetical protein
MRFSSILPSLLALSAGAAAAASAWNFVEKVIEEYRGSH